MHFLFFKKTVGPVPVPAPLAPGFTLEFWRPGRLRLRPGDLPAIPFLAWGLCHALRVFASRDYAIVLIHEDQAPGRDRRIVHRTCLLPAHFRFPFMQPGDLQAAGLWTHPDQRGTGLGHRGLLEAFHRLGDAPRTLWYMVREDNAPSIRLAEKAGFQFWGRGRKSVTLGLGLLGAFEILEGPDLP